MRTDVEHQCGEASHLHAQLTLPSDEDVVEIEGHAPDTPPLVSAHTSDVALRDVCVGGDQATPPTGDALPAVHHTSQAELLVAVESIVEKGSDGRSGLSPHVPLIDIIKHGGQSSCEVRLFSPTASVSHSVYEPLVGTLRTLPFFDKKPAFLKEANWWESSLDFYGKYADRAEQNMTDVTLRGAFENLVAGIVGGIVRLKTDVNSAFIGEARAVFSLFHPLFERLLEKDLGVETTLRLACLLHFGFNQLYEAPCVCRFKDSQKKNFDRHESIGHALHNMYVIYTVRPAKPRRGGSNHNTKACPTEAALAVSFDGFSKLCQKTPANGMNYGEILLYESLPPLNQGTCWWVRNHGHLTVDRLGRLFSRRELEVSLNSMPFIVKFNAETMKHVVTALGKYTKATARTQFHTYAFWYGAPAANVTLQCVMSDMRSGLDYTQC